MQQSDDAPKTVRVCSRETQIKSSQLSMARVAVRRVQLKPRRSWRTNQCSSEYDGRRSQASNRSAELESRECVRRFGHRAVVLEANVAQNDSTNQAIIVRVKLQSKSVILHLHNSIDAQESYCNIEVSNCLPRYSVVMQRPGIIAISPNSLEVANSSSAPSNFVR